MYEPMNVQAITAASKRLEEARSFLTKAFGTGNPSQSLDQNQILLCAQLLAIEYNSLVVEKSAGLAADNLKSYLHNEF